MILKKAGKRQFPGFFVRPVPAWGIRLKPASESLGWEGEAWRGREALSEERASLPLQIVMSLYLTPTHLWVCKPRLQRGCWRQ